MNLNRIKRLAARNDVLVSLTTEHGRRVIGLHGFLDDLQAVVQQIDGYFVERADSGFYLYSHRARWD